MAKVLLKFRDLVVSETLIGKTALTIGRDAGNDIQIDNPAVSGVHARIWSEGDAVYIEDAGSLNGTFVNGEKITRSAVGEKDEVTIGRHSLKILPGEGEAVPTSVDENEPLTPIIPSLDKTMVLDRKVQERLISSAKGEMGVFEVIDGPVARPRYELTDRVTTIGKSGDAEIRLKGFLAPKVAAMVNRTDKGYTITAAGTKSPPKVNGKAISGQHILKDNDVVEVGGLTLRFTLK